MATDHGIEVITVSGKRSNPDDPNIRQSVTPVTVR